MACLPAPTLSFTIPSLQDDLTLECRIYHPKCLAPTSISHITEWKRRAAIVAHPYATLGGCMDDPVVGLIATVCLSEGYVVGTFNFRGAGCSGGRTSWQGKGEQNDYKSFIAFMTYYIHHLSPPSITLEPNFTHFSSENHVLSPIPSQALPPPRSQKETQSLPALSIPNSIAPDRQPLLLLAGYSYGALITASLPPITSSILTPFQSPVPGSPFFSIRLRAQSLANQQNTQLRTCISTLLHTSTPRRGHSINNADIITNSKLRGNSVRTGGDEDLRRASHDSHRSFSMDGTATAVRKSVDRVRSMTSPKRARSYRSQNHSAGSADSLPSSSNSKPEEESLLHPIPGLETQFKTAYLLVSPLQGLVSNLVTFWNTSLFKPPSSSPFSSLSSKLKIKDKIRDEPPDALSEHERKLTIDPTLAVYGDSDVFVSVKRLRMWAERLRSCGNGVFRHVEVEGAGHFWHVREDVEVLREEVRVFVGGL